MINVWQLQEAKGKFSELVEKAILDGPQYVTKRGKDAIVVLSVKEFKKLNKSSGDLVSFFKNAPKIDLDIQRIKEWDRKVDLS
jgi:prevent-host-death family protein